MQIDPLVSDAPAIVYIDVKSPYAYLAIEPTRELERELGVQFDWRPFVLDIPSYLGSARLGAAGEVVEQQRSEVQWAGVKYAYYDCRRYAALQDIRIRGTEKIWDTNLISTAILWAQRFGHERQQALISSVYPTFWNRELDVEREAVVVALLDALSMEGERFIRWAHDEGFAVNAGLQAAAFAEGIYGVPTYVVGDQRYFGCEHLPSVRWHLQGEPGERPDVANPLPAGLEAAPEPPKSLQIGVDDSLDCLLALPRLFALLVDFPGVVQWVAVEKKPPEPRPNEDDGTRGAMHARFREANLEADAQRYAGRNLSGKERAQGIAALLESRGISLDESGPERLRRPAMPGLAVLMDEELFIGRQHLPWIALKLGQQPLGVS